MSIFLQEFRKGAAEAWRLYFMPLRAIANAIRLELAKDAPRAVSPRR